jgi:hypothetical protein
MVAMGINNKKASADLRTLCPLPALNQRPSDQQSSLRVVPIAINGPRQIKPAFDGKLIEYNYKNHH